MSFQSPRFVSTSISPAQFREQYIANPSHPISIVKNNRSVEPFEARINGHTAKNSDYASFFGHVVGLESVSGEVAYVDASKRVNFAGNPVLKKISKFVDLRLSTFNTVDKLNSVFVPVTRALGLTDHSYWLASRHSIVEVTERRVSEVQAYSEYVKSSEFETRNFFERENIQIT